MKLKGHEYAQAYVLQDETRTLLVSYRTTVCSVDADGFLTCYGLYSRTTIRHIGWFMREYYGLDYYFAKRCFVDGIQVNVFTGEIKE